MDTTNTADEQDLAKALDGAVSSLADDSTDAATPSAALSFEETTPAPGSEPVVLPGSPIAPPAVTDVHSTPSSITPISTPVDSPAPTPVSMSGPLDAIKQDALVELRPLVDKLTVGPEEKFDTYLLLIRSTDDASLIAPAHEAAKAIPDETRRVEALLDIIKEIDYLSKPKQD